MPDLNATAALHKLLDLLCRHLHQGATDRDLTRCADEAADLVRSLRPTGFRAALAVDVIRRLLAARATRERDLHDAIRDLEDELSHHTVDPFARPSTDY